MHAKLVKTQYMKQNNDFVFVFLSGITLLPVKMNAGKFYMSDPWLNPFINVIEERINRCI